MAISCLYDKDQLPQSGFCGSYSSLFQVMILNSKPITWAHNKCVFMWLYGSELRLSGFNSSCNANCSCSLDLYNPICGVDNIMYYSPCHAGCSGSIQVHSGESDKVVNSTNTPSMTAYTQCSCISVPSVKRIAVEHNLPIDVMAMRQKCKSPCTYQLYIFVFLLFFFFLVKFLNSMPMLSATLRWLFITTQIISVTLFKSWFCGDYAGLSLLVEELLGSELRWSSGGF